MANLGIRSGKLFRSFMLGNENTLTKVNKVNNLGISVIVGSKLPYAEIQDKGGFIKATPTGGFLKYKMAWWMWFKYKETLNKFWLINAWAVRKNGGVNIKATHYFENAIKDFEQNTETDMLNDLNKEFETLLNKDEKNNFENVANNTTKILREFAVKIPNYFLISLSNNMTDRGKETGRPEFVKKVTWVA